MPAKKNTAPKNQKKTTPKGKKAQKSPAPVVETPAPVETVDTAPVETPVETPVESNVNSTSNNVSNSAPNLLDYESEMREMEEQLKTVMATVKSVLSNLSSLQKKVAREKKVVDRKMRGKVKKVKDPNAPPTVFEKPVEISPELSEFLGTKKGEKVSRANVTSRVSAYCKESGLQNKSDGRKIVPDSKLSKLLNIQQGVEMSFFELQKHLKYHYPETMAKVNAKA